jgi:hypothetical protein
MRPQQKDTKVRQNRPHNWKEHRNVNIWNIRVDEEAGCEHTADAKQNYSERVMASHLVVLSVSASLALQ